MTNRNEARERLARIIDPKAWAFCDRHSNGPFADAMRVEISIETKPSLDKADAILALLSTEEVGGSGVAAALERLANAADCYGVQHLDTDDLDEYAEELQAATLAARALLADQPLPTATPKSDEGSSRDHALTDCSALEGAIRTIPTRKERIGGQWETYVSLDEVLAVIGGL